MESGSGWGAVRRSETFIISDRQLPPGHDPGVVCCEAPDGRQRGSQPYDVLVECRGAARSADATRR
jgi:hypothetical protein